MKEVGALPRLGIVRAITQSFALKVKSHFSGWRLEAEVQYLQASSRIQALLMG